MSLASELAETNALLRAAARPQKPQEPRRAPLGRRAEPAPVQATTFLLAAAEKDRIDVFANFRTVPDDRFTRDGKDVTVNCSCGTATDLRLGQLARCKCDRWYWNGTAVKWAPAPEPHECKANPAGWCDECGEDV